MSLTNKKASLTFNIAGREGSYEYIRLNEGFHIAGNIEINTGSIGSTLVASIFGLSKDNMNRLSLIGDSIVADRPVMRGQSNTNVTLEVGEADGPMQIIFVGNVNEAWADYSGGDPCLHFNAQTISIAREEVKDGISLQGQRSTLEVISYICNQFGWQMVNHGGWAQNDVLHDIHLGGTFTDMLDEVKATKHGSDYLIDRMNSDASSTNGFGIVHVYGPRFSGENETGIIISKANGLIGYPQYSAKGLNIKCVLRPEISYNSVIKIQSDYIPFGWQQNSKGQNASGQVIGNGQKPWDGKWVVLHAQHEFSTRVDYGSWFTYLECQPTNIASGKVAPVH